MSLADALRLLMRLLHIGATTVWIGGGLLYMLARAQLRTPAGPGWHAFAQTWGVYAQRGFVVLIASGLYLLLDRLTNPRLSGIYLGVLVVKLGTVAVIAGLLLVRVRPSRLGMDPTRLLWGLAVAAGVFGVLLTVLYEGAWNGP